MTQSASVAPTAVDDATALGLRPHAALVLVTAAWGAAFPLTKVAVGALGPERLIVLRFAVAALCLLPLARRSLRHPGVCRAGIGLGAVNLGIYWLLTHGIMALPAARVAFLLGSSVVWVPLMQALLRRRWPAGRDALAAATGLLGVVLMAGRPGVGLGAADATILAAAWLTAAAILWLQRLTGALRLPAAGLVFWEFTATAAGALPLWWLAPPQPLRLGGPAWLAIAYVSVVGTAVAYGLQGRYQRHVGATAASLIYALKPLFAALFASLFFGERLGAATCAGGALVLAASLMPRLTAPRRATAAAVAAPARVAAGRR